MSNFKLRPIIAEPIQNPKSKIQNRVTLYRLPEISQQFFALFALN
ncbi:MAG TPA: hypothetical protein V6C90_19560 [Coleofasciculaceae cyanobacterium]